MLITHFIDYISLEKRYSVHTQTAYIKDLEDFSKFLLQTESHQNYHKVDKKIIRNFMVFLAEKKLSKRSINRKLSSLRSFYLFLLKIGEIEVSPLETISSLQFYAEKQVPFSEEEMQNLSDKYDELPQKDLLKELIIETLYLTGMRKAELCNLLLKNVDFSNKQLSVTGKGNKVRVIPFSDTFFSQLKKYLEIRKPLKDSEVFFFVNKNGKKLEDKFVYSTVKTYLSLVTSKKKKGPHILRHSFATHVLNHGAEISKVKKILGHQSLASTQVYTTADIEQLKKVFNNSHPRAKKEKGK